MADIFDNLVRNGEVSSEVQKKLLDRVTVRCTLLLWWDGIAGTSINCHERFTFLIRSTMQLKRGINRGALELLAIQEVGNV